MYDNSNNLIKQLTLEDYKDIKYDDLPDVFIDALLSCEDIRFFMHDGIDIPRLLSALKEDIFSMSFKQGASTLTQQLAKNMFLSKDKTISRKIKEYYLTKKIERIYSKEDILVFYCNYICFDGVNNGIESATHKFFNKSIKNVSLPEAALLAGIVNLPTVYNPFTHPEKANDRKNTVLSMMYKNGYINKIQFEHAHNVNIKDLLYYKIDNKNTYPYQAYIDIVYQQIKEKTGYDIYQTPMEIYTYMDTSLQKVIDNIQNGKDNNITFNNDLMQFASAIIDNNSGALIASFGGRNYLGQKLYNRAYSMLKQPASTIKVILEYALAFEYLNWSNKQILKDIPINYPNSTLKINNVDNTYMGDIYISDALGYSRNTTAISTLEKVINKIGLQNVINYLKELNLMDAGSFSYSYGLGGFSYGVNMVNLAAAYSMIARMGTYIEPLTIKSIKLLDGSNKTINFTPIKKRILDETSCYLLTDCLLQVMDNNIWNIKACKADNVIMVGKTGTSSFDKKTIKEFNYPEKAAKDRLLASYSVDYTIASWSGFDETLKDKKTYFYNNSYENNLVKRFNKYIFSLINDKNIAFKIPYGLEQCNIVKGSNNILSTLQVEKDYQEKALFKSDSLPNEYFKEILIQDMVNFDYFVLEDNINFFINNTDNVIKYNTIYDYEKAIGGKNIYIDIYQDNTFIETILVNENILSYPINKKSNYQFDIYFRFKNGINKGPISTISF